MCWCRQPVWPDPRGSIAQLAVHTAGQGLALPNGFAKQTLTSASVHGSARSRPIHCAHLASPWCERGVSSTVRSRETVLLEHSTNSSAVAVQCSAVQCSAVQCSAVQCSAVQCSAVQCSAVQGRAGQRRAVQCADRPPKLRKCECRTASAAKVHRAPTHSGIRI